VGDLKDKNKWDVSLFIALFIAKRERNMLAAASRNLSVASFQKIWDNEEDAVYDGL
jgi:hypothetical protein